MSDWRGNYATLRATLRATLCNCTLLLKRKTELPVVSLVSVFVSFAPKID